MDVSGYFGKYSNHSEEVAGFVGGAEDGIERASLVVLGAGQQAVIAGFGEGEAEVLGEVCLMLAVDLLEGDVKGGDEPGGESLLDHQIIFGVIKFEVDYLADPVRVVPAQIIKIIEHLRISLHLCVPHPRRQVVYIIPSLILIVAA